MMPPTASAPPDDSDAPARALARLRELSPDIRAAAVLTRAGRLVVGEPAGEWQEPIAGLWEAADAAGPGATQLHVGTEDGEVFAVRDENYAVVAVSRRFALASLMLCDLRALLRDLDSAAPSAAADGEESR